MIRSILIAVFIFISVSCFSQLFVARDTLTVLENNYVLKMPWANGINYSNVSSVDLDLDGKKDLVAFDRVNQSGFGSFRCFINTGNPGETKYRADPDMSYRLPKTSSWAIFYDYDCDGKEDLLCSTTLGIMVYRNVSTLLNKPAFSLLKPLLMCNYNPTGPPAIANLYASSVGVPGLADVDNDTDLDILTFSSQGVFIDFYKNMSFEKGYGCDSLIFDYSDYCWGKLSESMCSVEFTVCNGFSAADVAPAEPSHKTLHAGSCLTCIDSDGDHDQDLILGDISCDIVQYIHNTGSVALPLFTDTTKLYPNYPNKGSTTQIRMNTFPCTYYIDANGDGKKDLIATPNAPNGENFNSVWYYKNTSTTNTVNFQFVKKNFLQDEMIEVGQNSFPVVFDYNADGKKDLLIGTYGYYTNTALLSKLTLYENVGTTAQPVYSLVMRDYANISAQGLNNVMPAVGDIDGDGDTDIVIGTSSGQIHWLENTAGPGNICNFSVFKNNPFSFTTNSAAAAPQLFDIDNDGKLDLLIGTKNGRIAYYKNTGTTTAPAFSLITNTFGNVDVRGDVVIYGIEGYAAPYFFNDGGDVRLLVGSITGRIFYYDVYPDLTTPFFLFDGTTNGLNEGAQSTVCFEDVTNDGKRDLFVGNGSGGLSFFSSQGPSVGIENINPGNLSAAILLFPNPAENTLNVHLDKVGFDTGTITITDLLGKKILSSTLKYQSETIDITALQNGIYFVTVSVANNGQATSATHKIIKE